MKMSKNDALTPRQLRILRALLTQNTVTAAAGAAGVGESTVYRALSDPVFRQALAQVEGEAVAAAGRRLAMLAENALDTVAEVMTDPTTPAPTRVRACEIVLANLMKFREVIAFETRLDALEREVRGERFD